MNNTILIKNNKSIITTSLRPIYEGENRVDDIVFYIDADLYPDFNTDTVVVLMQVILPYEDELGSNAKMRYMTIEDEMYKGKYVTKLPITSVLTKKFGEVILWFMFVDVTDPEHVKTLKTDYTVLRILQPLKESSIIIDDDKSYNVLAQLEKDVKDLKDTRMDKTFDYDPDNQTIQFYANGEKYGSPIHLDTEVKWSNWEE